MMSWPKAWKVTLLTGVYVSFGFSAGASYAQDTEPPPTQSAPADRALEEDAPRHLKRPGSDPEGVVQVFLPVQISLSDGEVGKPVFMGPNASYGVTDRLTVRVLHGEAYRSPDAVAGVCFTGRDGGCPRAYNNVSADVLYVVTEGETLSLTVNGGMSVPQMQPVSFGIMFGGVVEWSVSEKFALQVEPGVLLALDDRQRGNPHRLGVTGRALVQVSEHVLLFGLAGLFGPFSGFAGEHRGPVGAGGFRSIGPDLDLGAQFTFTNVYGADATLDERQMTILTALRI